MNNTKKLGNIGEAVVLAAFVERHIPVYIPFGENERCDLIAEFNGKLNKIQIKTSEKIKNNIITWNIRSMNRSKGKYVAHKYDETEIDYFALYNIETKLLLLVPINEILSRTSINFTYPFCECKTATLQHNWENYTFDKILN